MIIRTQISSMIASMIAVATRSIPSALVLAATSISPAAAVGGEYRLHSGDVLEIAVVGMPELKQRVTVQVDGGISLPLLGTITVAGATIADARAKIQAGLATKVFRHTGTDGRERPVVIKYDEVSAAVVEYRPIYVHGGEVMKPELTYRPNMTVRQAVGAAGGYYELRFQTYSVARDVIEVKGELASLWVSLANERLLISRLSSESTRRAGSMATSCRAFHCRQRRSASSRRQRRRISTSARVITSRSGRSWKSPLHR